MAQLIGGRVHKLAARLWTQGRCSRIRSPGNAGGREPPLIVPPRALRRETGGIGASSRRGGEASSWLQPNAALRRRLLCRFFCCGTADASDAAMMPPGMAATCCQGCVRKTALPWRRYRHAEADFPMPMGNRQASARKKPQIMERPGPLHDLRCAGAPPWGRLFSEQRPGRYKRGGRCSRFLCEPGGLVGTRTQA